MKRWYAIGGGVLLAMACVLLGVVAWLKLNPSETAETRVQAAVAEQAAPAAPQDGGEAPYESPVDFASLWEMNPDIYAWLYISGTEINYPILQREGDDSYYLSHSSEGKEDAAGSIFTEETYTKKDFSDPVTVIYGHHMRSGAMFGNLQELYSAPGGIEENREVVIYLPDGELRYQVFAAVPHDMRHILYYNDFGNPEVFEAFLEQVLSARSINASIDEGVEVTAADQLLILSTCLRGDSHQRYLVLAKRTAGSAAP